MTMTSRDVMDLVENGGGLAAGRAQFLLRDARRSNGSTLTPAQRAFLTEVAQTKPATSRIPSHPATSAGRQRYLRDVDTELSAVELAWLDRLPRDPERVTFDDAERLSALASSISSTKAPSSARLLDTVWAPVKAVHDRRVAAARLEQAKADPAAVPATAGQALLDALAAQHEGLSRDALSLQTETVLSDLSRRRADAHVRAIDQARQRVDDLERDHAEHTALTREPVA